MVADELHDLLNDKKQLLTEIYFELQTHFESKYGNDTVVTIELGTFFEVYEVNNDEHQIGKAKEMAELLNIQLTRKNKTILENSIKNPLMAGVPSISFERYLSRIIAEEKYTVVIIKQRGIPPKITRYIDSIVSPGTNFDYIQDHDNSFVTSLLIDQNNGIYSVGYAAIDVTTGSSYLYDAIGSSEDRTLALDEVFNLMTLHRSKEVVLTFNHEEINQKEVLRYLEIEEHYSYVLSRQRMKILYQNELFREIYRIQSLLAPIEHLDLERTPQLSESLAILIDFIIQHDTTIVQKLAPPELLNNQRYMYLGNNAGEQLGIISRDPGELSIFKLIDFTSTSMGKRLLKERLLNPVIDKEELARRYNLCDKLSESASELERELKNIYDLERITRRIQLQRLHPCELNYLYTSLESIRNVSAMLKKADVDIITFKSGEVATFIHKIETTFDLEKTAKCNLNQIEENFIKEGNNKELDELTEENNKLYANLEEIASIISRLISQNTGKKEDNYVSIGILDKEGHYIHLTKNRYYMIEEELKKQRFLLEGKEYFFSDFYFKVQTNNVKITAQLIDEISAKIITNQARIAALTKEQFLKKLESYEKEFADLLDKLKLFVSDIDVSVSNIKASRKFNYVRPQIVQTDSDKNFLQLIELRHPLIEANEDRGIYIPNDMILGEPTHIEKAHRQNLLSKTGRGEEVQGVLLYGINSSGKSSLMKSIGIAVIMAQAGLYVPASSMKFSLFDGVFTRIVGKDNLSKGLSTFAVEMLELKNIFNRATPKSLVLGDEISHGTETLSGVSIVSSAILKLSQIRCLFVFATHLHQLVDIKEIQELSTVISLHLGVTYDESEDKLLFNRKLESGSGSTVYGLEFARSLHMDSSFIRQAEQIRKQLSADYEAIELLTKKKKSRYNKKLYITSCAICGEPADDVHHINEQSNSDDSGFTGHHHKNHRYNLVPLCKNHHDAIHNGNLQVKGFVMTDKGLELHYEEGNPGSQS